MSQMKDLEALAALAGGLSAERRHELEGRFPFEDTPRRNAGIVRGLARAAEGMEGRFPEAARELREMAAVGAARVLVEDEQFRKICAEIDTPEARAQMQAEADLFLAGKLELVPLDDVIREMEERTRKRQARQGNGQ
jgi:hypothetical protein